MMIPGCTQVLSGLLALRMRTTEPTRLKAGALADDQRKLIGYTLREWDEGSPHAEGERENDVNLLLQRHFEGPDPPEGQHDNDEVRYRVEDATDVKQRVRVDAVTRDGWVPDLGPWDALQYLGDIHGNVEQHNDDHECDDSNVKMASWQHREHTSVQA